MKFLGGGQLFEPRLALGAITITHGEYGWELRRTVHADGTFEIEAVATPRFREVLEAGRVYLAKNGFAGPIPKELRKDAMFWPQAEAARWWPLPPKGDDR